MAMYVFLNRPGAVWKSLWVPSPIPGLRKPHRIDHKGLKTQIFGHSSAAKYALLVRVWTTAIQIEVIGESWVGIPFGEFWDQLFQYEAMQGVASIIDIAHVATDKRWRNQERLTRC